MANVSFEHVYKRYDEGPHAVSDLCLDIADGELLVLVGPSGCGKTTALRMVAGLEDVSKGIVRIGGDAVNDVSPGDRDIAMVFQSYALYPHMTVARNIGYPLRLRKIPASEVDRKVRSVAELLGLTPYLDRKPRQLSGGQRQRVAMGRAIVREPRLFLMDEPLSNLDAKLRVQMRAEIARIQREIGVTTIYVTHDQVEAMTMGDRVAVLQGGVLQQADSPQTLYDNPCNLFVAGFIGSPCMNFAMATIERDDTGGLLAVLSPESRFRISGQLPSQTSALGAHVGRRVVLGMRAEDIANAGSEADVEDRARLKARVVLTEALGSEIVAHLQVMADPLLPGDLDKATAAGLQDTAALRVEPGFATFVARFAPRTPAHPGETIMVSVDTARLHFFDPGNGQAIR